MIGIKMARTAFRNKFNGIILINNRETKSKKIHNKQTGFLSGT